MANKNYYWNQPASKVIPMRKLKQNYIKEVEHVNLNDLKTKYTMIIISQWSEDSDGYEEVYYALKYMNGKYWLKISDVFADSVSEDDTRYVEEADKWSPTTVKELQDSGLFDGNKDAIVFSDVNGGVLVYAIPYSAKGLHGYQSTTPRRRASPAKKRSLLPSQKNCPVKVNVRKMF